MLIKNIIPFLEQVKDQTKVHCASGGQNKKEPLFAFSAGKFKEWQEGQNRKNFERKYILSLIYMKNNEWLFAGIYESLDVKESSDSHFIYRTELLEVGTDMIGKMVIGFEKDFRASYLLLNNYIDMLNILEIRRDKYKIDPFPGFDNVFIKYDELKEIIKEEEKTWFSALSNVKGIYLISDSSTGKLYVGSAYGEDAFWQRWKSYADTGHGNNKLLKKLLDQNGFEYSFNFRFSILEIRNMNTEDQIIIGRENYWKNCLFSREFGYNDN